MDIFICPRCGGHHFGREVMRAEPESRTLVLGRYQCHAPGCGWSGSRPPEGWKDPPPNVLHSHTEARLRAEQYLRNIGVDTTDRSG